MVDIGNITAANDDVVGAGFEISTGVGLYLTLFGGLLLLGIGIWGIVTRR